MIIEPMDDFWKQMLDELNNTTEEEWRSSWQLQERGKAARKWTYSNTFI